MNEMIYDLFLIHDKKFESYTFEVIFTVELDNNTDLSIITKDCYLFNSPITNLE